MADNTTLDAGAGGDTIATDDIGGIKYEIVKQAFGALDAVTLVTTSSPLPVDIRDANATVTVAHATLADAHSADFDSGAGTDTTPAFGIAVPASGGAAVIPGDATAGLKVDLGADNDVTLATLPDTGAGDLAAINAAVSGTLTVGSHAVTNAGTFVVQENGAALTALQLIDDVVYVDDADWTALTSKHALMGGIYQSTPGTITDGDTGPARMTANGALHVAQQGNVTADLGATDNAVLDAIQAAVEVMDDWDETNRAAVNLISGQAGVAGGSGVVGATTQRVVLATDVALPAGTNAIGKLAANSGVDIGDVDVTSISAGSNLIGNVGLGVRTSGGMTIFRSLDIDQTEEEIKATAGQVYSISAFNHTAAPLYLKFYNATAATVVVGTTTPVLTFTVPGNADSDGAGFIWNNEIGFAFGTAITVACTTAIGDADTGAPGDNACSVNIGYN